MIKSRWVLNEMTPKFGFNGFGEATIYYQT